MHSQESGVPLSDRRRRRLSLDRVRQLLSYLPGNNQDDPPYIRPIDDPKRRCSELEEIVPHRPAQTVRRAPGHQ